MREVIVINPNAAPLHDKIRTAAYCRVSSDSDEQLASFSAQVSEYTARIQKNPDWVMADIYADEGISGVSAAKRPEFQRMMADCRRKKIDRILTKSISRFARNVKECIEYIRELQSLGVSIEFEKEGIDTAFLSGEMMIAVFGSLAQEESKSISSNMRLSYKSRMERGEFMGCTAPYGYRLVNGSLVIQATESVIIQWIFSAYLMGYGQNSIIEQLMQQGVPAPNGGACWNTEAISYILRNERYCGDSLFQKFYTEDGPRAKHKRNRGERQQYYVTGSHTPIVSDEVFQKVQRLMDKKSQRVPPKGKPTVLQKRIICAKCNSVFIRRIRANGHVAWVCRTHDQKASDCPVAPIAQEKISNAYAIMIACLYHNRECILLAMVRELEKLRDKSVSGAVSLTELNKCISDIAGQLHILSRLKARELIDEESYMAQTNELNRKLRDSQEQRRITIQEQQEDDALDKTREIIDVLQNAPENLASLEDGGVFEAIVDKVIIDKDNNITFRLVNGLELGGFHG